MTRLVRKRLKTRRVAIRDAMRRRRARLDQIDPTWEMKNRRDLELMSQGQAFEEVSWALARHNPHWGSRRFMMRSLPKL